MKAKCDCGACNPHKCVDCGEVKEGFEDALGRGFFCVDCINKSWHDDAKGKQEVLGEGK